MIRLLKIEGRKVLTYRVFWIFLGLYLFSLVISCWAIPELTDLLAESTNSNELKLLRYFMFNFPDIWQNTTFALSLRFGVKILLGIIVITNICNEYSYKTLRQNIVCGMERVDILKSKTLVVLMLSLISTFVVAACVMYLGLFNSSTVTLVKIMGKTSFLFAYFVEVFTYLSFALMLGLVIQKAGFAIITLYFAPILELILKAKVFPESWGNFLPIESMNHLITSPNTSLIEVSGGDFPFELQTHVDFMGLIPIAVYLLIFYGVIYFVLKKKNF